MKKSEPSSHSVVCWGSACKGNFSAPGWPPAKASEYEAGMGALTSPLHHNRRGRWLAGWLTDGQHARMRRGLHDQYP
jgi:hypothetical protein